MADRHWLNLKAYKLHLFMARDMNGKGEHTLVFVGPGVANHRAELEQLGFALDKRFVHKEFWTRTIVGMNHSKIQKVFPLAQLELRPEEKIMPGIKVLPANRQAAKPRTEKKQNAQLSDARNLPRDAHGRGDVASTGVPAALGSPSPRDDVRPEPENDRGAEQEGRAEELPAATAREADGGLAGAAEAVASAEPAPQGEGESASGESVLDQSLEAGGSGDADRGSAEEHDAAGRGELTASGGRFAVEFLIDRSQAWFRFDNGDDAATLIDGLPAQLSVFIDRYNIPHESTNVQARVVDDLSGQVVHLVSDSSLLIGGTPDIKADAPEQADPEAGSDDSLHVRIKQLFDRGQHIGAYALFKQDPTANPLSFDDFLTEMYASAGGPEAALRLTRAQRTVLSRDMGLSSDGVELFAKLGLFSSLPKLHEILSGSTGEAAVLAKTLEQREERIKTALEQDGWTLEPASITPEDRGAKWRRAVGQQLYREAASDGWLYAGADEGNVLPLFSLTDSLEQSTDELIAALRAQCAVAWGQRATMEAAADLETGAADASSQPAPAGLEAGAGDSAAPQAKSRGQVAADDDDEEPGIDRVWRGTTYKSLLNGQRQSYRSVVIAMRAFEALVKVETQGHAALTERERGDLAGFTGWGGIAQEARTDSRTKSKNRNGEDIAKALGMDAGEFNRVMLENRLESYYTPAPLVGSVWKALRQAGVTPHGRYLDAGCGAANFFSGAPEEIQRHARLIGVECDPMAARLARANAPDATIIEKRLEQAVLDRGFDAVVGNVPFGETRIFDSNYPNAQHIHDYFIVRSLDHLKAGGVMAVITSSGTLDKKDPKIRQQMMERANLVAAFRLPAEVFGAQGASVTTDIVILQRRPDGTAPDYDFTETAPLAIGHGDEEDQEFLINQYFHDHPENVLGDYTVASSAFGPKLQVRSNLVDSAAVVSTNQLIDGIVGQLEERIAAAVPNGIASRTEWPQAENRQAPKESRPGHDLDTENATYLDDFNGFVGDYTLSDDKIVVVLDIVDQFDDDGIFIGRNHLAEDAGLSAGQEAVVRAYIPLRDAARALIRAQLEGDDAELAQAQEHAKNCYNAFVESFGPVNSDRNVRILDADPGSAEVMALELWDDEEQRVTALAETFTQRVVRPDAVLKADTAEDAYFLSIDRKGKVDLAFMEEVSSIAREGLLKELLGHRVFIDPLTQEYVDDLRYLSGNVVKKLEEAQQASLLDERFDLNVVALKAVQPTPIPFEDITVRLGANWIPIKDIRDFAAHLVEQESLSEADFAVRYNKTAGIWSIEVSSAFKRDYEAARTAMYGTENISFESLLEKLLNNQRPSHYVKIDGKSVLDEEATLASRSKQSELNELFYQWIASSPERVERITELYNQSTNVIRVPRPDGSRLTFPGLSPTWNPRFHQKDMVAMSMMGYNDMAAHPVGAGKTFEMVAIAMKLRQLGMHQKPMIAVPNHMLGQIAREAKQMYPGARVLMVTNEDLKGNSRKRFLAIARNNQWDIVVCTHSLLNQISAPLDIQLREYDKQIDLIHAQIAETDNKRLERKLEASLKSVQSRREDVIQRFEATSERAGVLTIDQLGVDALLVDEAHLYKNLALNSAMNVLGVTTTSSNRAFNLCALGEYLRDLHGKSAGLHFFTGTPIANTMCELYVHNKMLRPELLEEIGISHFDEWANRFGDVVSSLEALPEGGGFRMNERFARFVNLPEMIRLFRSFADVKNKEQLNLPTPTVHTHTISVEQTEWQQAFMKHLAMRAVAVRKGKVDPSEDNMLSISTAGRKASLDMRLVADILPEDSSAKLQAVANNIHSVWERTAEVKGTQLVFMDLGTPGKDKPFSCYDALKALLVEKGIDPKEVAFIHEAKTNEAKEKIFEKVRSGEIRVLLGSTEKMGVGTNVQERLCALHNVDCPWRPADIEQRIGRIARQGNKFFTEVEEYRYTTKDSFDLFMWETNKRKATFISQALADPAQASREVSEEMDLGYAEVMAVTTGNPRIREKVELDDKVNKLERKGKAWFADRANKASLLRHYKRDIEVAKERLAVEEKVKAALPDCRYAHVTVEGAINELQDGSTSWLYATQIGVAVASRLPKIEAMLMRNNERIAPLNMRVGEIDLVATIGRDKITEIRGSLNGELLPINIANPSKNDQLMGKRLRDWFRHDERIKELQDAIASTQKNLAMIGDIDLTAPWPFKGELDELKSRKRELDAWFASQDFDGMASGPDPFLIMLAEYRSSVGEEDSLDILREDEEAPSEEIQMSMVLPGADDMDFSDDLESEVTSRYASKALSMS